MDRRTQRQRPADEFVLAAEGGRKALQMGQVVDDRPHGVLALHVELGRETPGRHEIGAEAAHAHALDLGEQIGAAIVAAHAPGGADHHGAGFALHNLDARRRIDHGGHIGGAVRPLAVVAMAEELRQRLCRQFDLDSAAAALNAGHGHSFPHRQS